MDKTPLLLDTAFQGHRSKHFPRGQIILYQGDPPMEVYFLKSGIVKMHDIDEQGNEKVLHLFRPWALMPFAFFSGDNHATQWFYTALTDCDVSVMPFDKLSAEMQSNGELAIYLTRWFSTEVHELLVRMSSLGKTNGRDKLVAALKFLAVHHAKQRRGGWQRVTFPVSQQLLADMTGMTRESAAMIMKQFKDDKTIRQPRPNTLEINLDKLIQ